MAQSISRDQAQAEYDHAVSMARIAFTEAEQDAADEYRQIVGEAERKYDVSLDLARDEYGRAVAEADAFLSRALHQIDMEAEA